MHVRQILEILRLLYRGADVLILDEPTAVLAPAQIAELLALMRKLKAEGRTILFISHKLEEVMSVADAITVMRAGRVVATTTPRDDQRRRARRGHGRRAGRGAADRRARRAARRRRCSSARGLVGRDALGAPRLGPVDLDIFPGEIVGVAGVGGNGQDELVACLAGLAAPAAGSLSFAGADMRGASTAAFRAAGVGYVSADRAEEGLCQTRVDPRQFHRRPRERDFRARRRAAARAIDPQRARARSPRFRCAIGRLRDPVVDAVGRQPAARSRSRASWTRAPKLLVAAQPTRGVDIAGAAFIHRQARRVSRSRRRGAAGLRIAGRSAGARPTA